MTSLDVRNNSAVMKRAEQLKRWEESDTNHQPATPRPERGNRIKFSSGCIFLAACLSGDKDEVLKMLEQGADINTSNVDGLTALHQACIDDNLEMVEFLVEHGADINRQDNEGWTPLHATASCGFVSIARYLVEHGADVAAVNSDGDLAVDLAVDIQHVPMIDFMQKMVAEQQIDCTKARQAEEQQMLSDAKRWLRSDASEVNRPHPKTGATALHVAAAKGYTKVLSLLLAGRANVDAQDNDGWTPLHAAAHWGQKEAAEMLVDAMGDMDVRNYAGQTCIDVADRKMVKFLEELRPNNKRIKRRPSSQIRISDTIESHIDKASAKIIRVEVRPENNKDHANASSSLASASVTRTTTTTTTGHNLTTNSESEETDSELTDSTESSHSTSLSDNQDNQEDEKSTNEIPAADDETPWRRSNNVPRGRTPNESSSKIQVPDRDVNKTTTTNNSSDTSDIILRRTQSFENDEKKSPPLSPTTTPPTSNALSTTSSIHTTPTTTTTSNAPAIVNTTLIRRSFVPPVRDEESETQRKAHAKRVRETRRSTQGVTLDEIKSAEELVKKKNSAMNNNNNNNNNNNTSSSNNDTQASKTSNNIPINSDSDTLAITEEQSSKITPPKMIMKYECDAVNQKSSEDDDIEISASFTLMATSSGKLRSLPNVAGTDSKDVNEIEISSTEEEEGEDGGEKEEVSATFIMAPRKTSRTPTPTESHETTVVVPPPHQRNRLYSRSSSVSDDESNAKENRRRRLRSIKHNRENDNKKTESPSPPPPAEGMRKPSTPTRQLNSQRVQSANERVRSAFFNPLPLSTQHTSIATLTSPITTLSGQYVPSPPTLGSPVRLREKRPYFDPDHTNNTITLAEKLRNEANKYNENNEKRNDVATSSSSAGNNEGNEQNTTSSSIFGPITGVGYNYTSRRSLDSSSLPSSPLHTRERESGGNDFSNVGSREISSAGFYPAERRPSWRMKFDTGSKFKLEDASSGNSSYPPNNSIIIPSAPAVIAAANLSSTVMSQRRTSGGMNPNVSSSANQSIHTIGRPVSAPPNSTITNSSIATLTSASATSSHTEADTSSTGSFMPRRVSASTSTTALVPETCTVSTTTTNSVATTTSGISSANDDRDNDKENDSRSALATQAVIQRRRKPKRRSTGVVHIDMDDLDPERQDDDTEDRESGGESRQPSRSRLAGLTSSITPSASSNSASDEKKTNDRSESVDNIDYKALWEAVKMENEKLKQQLKKKDEEIIQTRATLERLANATTKNSLSEIEKRERRTMERKLSELEEELKQLEVYKTENLRLKEENAALIRVISKLSK